MRVGERQANEDCVGDEERQVDQGRQQGADPLHGQREGQEGRHDARRPLQAAHRTDVAVVVRVERGGARVQEEVERDEAKHDRLAQAAASEQPAPQEHRR